MTTIDKILVLVDFSPCSDAALEYALALADEQGAEVEVLHVWTPGRRDDDDGSVSSIFAETPEGLAMEQRLSAAENAHAARVCGRLEFGDAARVILDILEREPFDLVVMGLEGGGRGRRHATDPAGTEDPTAPKSGHVTMSVARTTACRVVTMPPPARAPGETEAA